MAVELLIEGSKGKKRPGVNPGPSDGYVEKKDYEALKDEVEELKGVIDSVIGYGGSDE